MKSLKYCVIKNTVTVIDGSENSIESMLVNVQNAGFTESEVEILTEEEYQARKELEPVSPKEPTQEDYLLDLDFRLSMIELGL